MNYKFTSENQKIYDEIEKSFREKYIDDLETIIELNQRSNRFIKGILAINLTFSFINLILLLLWLNF